MVALLALLGAYGFWIAALNERFQAEHQRTVADNLRKHSDEAWERCEARNREFWSAFAAEWARSTGRAFGAFPEHLFATKRPERPS